MSAPTGRVLGVDVGDVRVGLALSDPGRVVASPFATLPAGDDLAERIAVIAREQECAVVVVGLPRSLKARDTVSTRMARDLAAALGKVFSDGTVRVELWDERLSSVEAERMLIDAGRRREQRRGERDRVAAAIILQGWLQSQR